jgi:hypothetical protein
MKRHAMMRIECSALRRRAHGITRAAFGSESRQPGRAIIESMSQV